jgi:hypothetical protein
MPDTPFDPQADDQELLTQAIEHYHHTLKGTDDGRNYLLRRGIANPEAIDHFRIGFVDYSLVNVLPSYQHNAGKAIRARLQGLGLMRSSSHQYFKGCLVFPITAADGSGRVVDIYGRRLSQGMKRGERHRHLSEVRQGVWNIQAFADTDKIVLCPSLFDALTFWCAGRRNVTCTFGPDALTEDHLTAFRDFGIRRVLLMAESTAPRLLAAGIECHLLQFPHGEDANQYARKSHEPAQVLGAITAKAVRIGTPAVQAATVTATQPEAKASRPATTPLCSDDDQTLLAQVIDFYHHTLKETTEGLDYLHSRGITAGEAVDYFRIGYANRTLGLRLPTKVVRAGKEIRTRLQKLGIYRANGREHFRGCLVFPVMADGRIVDLYGRRASDHVPKGTPLDIYLSDQRRGVWNREALRDNEEIILCPSLFDALAFWNAGYRNVTCTFGPDALTEDHLAAFAEFGIRRVLAASEAVVPKLLSVGIECYRLALPMGLDANQYALQVTNPAQALGECIRKAAWQGKGAGSVVPVVVTTGDIPQSAAVPDEVERNEVGADDDADTLENEYQGELDDDELEELEEEADALDDNEPDEQPSPRAPSKMVPLPHAGEEKETAGPPALPPAPAPILAASPLPPAPQDLEADVSGDEVTVQLGHRRYRIRGLSKNLAFDQLKVNVLATTEEGLYVDTLDLYVARHRRQFIAQAAGELGVEEQTIKKDLGRVLLKLEELQDEQVAKMLEPKEPAPTMTPEEENEALRLLRDPDLFDRIVADFDVVGETANKLVGYLAAVSRKLDQPLAIIIQSSSAAGKTSLMDAILSFVPPEDQVKYSAMTGQSLFYMGETNLKHKILAIVEEEGVERAAYALKLLQSEGALTIASTGKDGSTGRMVTQEYKVEGPVMIFLTTTSVRIDEELLNRCIVLSVDENREQTRAIHQFQRRRQTLAGLLADHDRQKTLAIHRNAQRLLRPLLVANPFAEELTFLDDKTRTRRDHVKYLMLIRAITLLRQYQRAVKTTIHNDQVVEYIEVSLDDIAVANRLACEALGRSADELPPQTRRLLGLVDEMVTKACQQLGIDRADHRFSRRDIRECTGWGHTQLKVHLKRLEDMEYLLIHRGGRGQSFLYELLYDPPPDAQSKFLAKLIDVEQLKCRYDADRSGANGQKSGAGRGQVGVKSGRSRGLEIDASGDGAVALLPSEPKVGENANLDARTCGAS